MIRVPLFLTFNEMVIGDDFIAGITFNARVLMEIDEDRLWIYGVNPGGIAGTGANRGEALRDFRSRLKAYLQDVVFDEVDFPSFQSEVKRFFDQAVCVEEWEAARDAMRAGADPEVGRDLHRETGLHQPTVQIRRLQLAPSANPTPCVEPPPAMAA